MLSTDLGELSQLANRLREQKPKAEIEAVECLKDGCWEADIIIFTVPSSEERIAAAMMKEVATQKIVVTLSARKNDHATLKKILPNSRLVNVWGGLRSKELFIAGNDDREANEEVTGILQQAGFHITPATFKNKKNLLNNNYSYTI